LFEKCLIPLLSPLGRGRIKDIELLNGTSPPIYSKFPPFEGGLGGDKLSK